ncbi:hypothetical protein MRB53_010803 [Persea americana]|uniref:Uncharacterized protein n=1 Tax=Persea americana TaxID=3435 RepID=A0ACC2LSR3_PERAE|nr:hypothetical protein MRB53_010803 [Persea americana]
MGQSKGVCATEDDQHSEDMDLEEDAIQEKPILQKSIEMAATITTIEKINGDKAKPTSENICPVTLDDGVINKDQREGSQQNNTPEAKRTEHRNSTKQQQNQAKAAQLFVAS